MFGPFVFVAGVALLVGLVWMFMSLGRAASQGDEQREAAFADWRRRQQQQEDDQ